MIEMEQDELINAHLSNGMMLAGGKDEKGYYVLWGPMIREVPAIMIMLSGDWVPFKTYKNWKVKTLRHRGNHFRWLKKRYEQPFKLQTIWQVVPTDEMEKTYYESEVQITEEISRRVGRPRGRVAMGFGRPRNAGPIYTADRTEGRVEQILENVGEDEILISVNVVPDAADENLSRRDRVPSDWEDG